MMDMKTMPVKGSGEISLKSLHQNDKANSQNATQVGKNDALDDSDLRALRGSMEMVTLDRNQKVDLKIQDESEPINDFQTYEVKLTKEEILEAENRIKAAYPLRNMPIMNLFSTFKTCRSLCNRNKAKIAVEQIDDEKTAA